VRGRAIAGVVALCLLAPAGAQAADVTGRGSVIVRWASNPETCASFGLCNRSGSLSWRPHGSFGAYEVFGKGHVANLALYEAPAIARSRRETAGGPRTCTEAAGGPFELSAAPPRGSRLARMTMDEVAGLDFGRCAGPLPSDFVAAMPRSKPFDPLHLDRRGGTIDMRGRTPFAAGPFKGEVVSALRFLVTPAPGDEVVSNAQARASARRPPFSRVELVYAIERIEGALTLGFTGTTDPTCEIFDVCGLHGEIAVGGNSTPGLLEITAGKDLRRGERHMTTEQALRALRAGRMSGFASSLFGDEASRAQYPPVTAPFDFTERSGLAGEQECSDTGRLLIERLDTATTRAGFTLALGVGTDEPPEQLRTHCPGPGRDGDVPYRMAQGTLPWAVLGDDELHVALEPARGFRSLAFAGAWRGGYDVVLRRVSVKAETRTLKLPENG
jgi:hypothetical protein